MNHIKMLYIYMNGERVGTLEYKSSSALFFSYHASWLQSELARPISLSMPLSEKIFSGDLVYNFFDNLLPDNLDIRNRIQARFGAKTNKCFDLLSYIGGDCIGALQILTEEDPHNIKKIQATPINDQAIAKLLKNYQSSPLGMNKNSDFRISLAGAQEKTALLWHKSRWYLPTGPTPTTHIIKLPMGYIKHQQLDLSESVENEWLCLQILSAYNLPVNYATITNFQDVKALVVERFDRKWINKQWLLRIPQEDFCQVLGVSSSLKYESDGGPGIIEIMKELRGANQANADRTQFMKSVFLFWVLGAIDGHAKNFSVKIERQGKYQLTPLYDVISAYPLAQNRQLEWKKLKMAMAVKGKNKHYSWHEIKKTHWLAMANLCQYPENAMNSLIEEVCDNMENIISITSQKLPKCFPTHISQPIFEGMRKVKERCR